jgi:hypothetical protein
VSQQLGPFFTLKHLQEFLDVGDRKNLREVLARHGAPFMNIGRETVFDLESFTAWIREESQKRKPTKSEVSLHG